MLRNRGLENFVRIFSVDHACGDDTAYVEDPAYVKEILADPGINSGTGFVTADLLIFQSLQIQKVLNCDGWHCTVDCTIYVLPATAGSRAALPIKALLFKKHKVLLIRL